MRKNNFTKYKKLFPLLIVPFILLLCYAIWSGMYVRDGVVAVRGENGIWDLRNIDFSEITGVTLHGAAEFVHGDLLTPDEFSEREDIVIGNALTEYRYSTSRIRILLPDNSFYTFTRVSAEFASRIL